ncbi:sensor domain-containing protein [Niallia sp. FSL R7-0271]|uniref:sensor domain-containing protein n=1 Tax=Niallia sp. FSL R7-0271 TaxID=2921678 RepID=UPI0030FA8E0B
MPFHHILDHFHTQYMIVIPILSIISCALGLWISKKVRKNENEKNRNGILIFGSLLLGFTFWITLYLIMQMVPLPYSPSNYLLYLISIYLFCFIGSLVILALAQTKEVKESQYFWGSLFLAVCILAADTIGFALMFKNHLHFNIILYITTSLLTIGSAFSVFRFVILITTDDVFQATSKRLEYIGIVLAGVSLANIPYIVLVSILKFNLGYMYSDYEIFIPFTLTIAANLLLMLLPYFLGDTILIKKANFYTSLFEHNPVAVIGIDLAGVINSVNSEGIKLLEYEEEELVGKSISEIFMKVDKEKIKHYLLGHFKGKVHKFETEIVLKNNTRKDVFVTAVRIITKEKFIGTFVLVEDITEKKKSEEQIKHLAFHDDLTQLSNRRLAKITMNQYVENNTPFTLMLLDFDRFKSINDTLGHSFGDSLLQRIAKRLNNLVEENGKVARFGGDEFLIIIPDGSSDKDMYKSIAKSINHVFRQPILIDGYEIILTASVGISRFPEHTTDVDDLVKYADIAMYQMKEAGANGFKEFNKEMSLHADHKVGLESDLQKAMDYQELSVYYQPKYHIKSGKIIGAEALLRWKHNKKGFIPPNEFIPLAEESGLIVKLEKYVFAQVCKHIHRWATSRKTFGRISINISIVTLLREDFVSFIAGLLQKYKIDGSIIELEITERIVMKNELVVNETLKKISELGISISMDDFGTGYSSLSYLHKLQVDCIKIDKSFIDQIEGNIEVVSAIISMAHNLKLEIIAEGVETEAQVQKLIQLGCEQAQGFYFSKPITMESFEAIL